MSRTVLPDDIYSLLTAYEQRLQRLERASNVVQPPTGTVGGDLSGTLPNPSVVQATFPDTRDAATTPDQYDFQAEYHFKTRTALGLPAATPLYAALIGLRGWGDDSGGAAHELAFTNESIYHRTGTEAASWANWQTLLRSNPDLASIRAQAMLTGGGELSYMNGAVRWTQRFIAISNTRGAAWGANGYFDINMPADGATVTGANIADVVVTADGIPLTNWQALYYILPIGAAFGSVAANFRIVSYAGTNFDIPSNWVLIAVRNDDAGAGTYVKFGTGQIVLSGRQNQRLPNALSAAPPGVIQMYGGSTAPYGWLLCQGQEAAIATYPGLYAVLGTSFGPLTNGAGAAGTTHFRLPDFRGRAPIGVGTGTGGGASGGGGTIPAGGVALTNRALGSWTGAETHKLLSGESGVPAHGHGHNISVSTSVTVNSEYAYNTNDHYRNDGTTNNLGLAITVGSFFYGSDGSFRNRHLHGHTATATSTVSGGVTNNTAADAVSAHPNVQPSLAVNFIIKT